jgi:hypothetical protein
VFIFVPYSHYDEPKTLSYFMQPVCLLNADGGQAQKSHRRLNEVPIIGTIMVLAKRSMNGKHAMKWQCSSTIQKISWLSWAPPLTVGFDFTELDVCVSRA